MKKRFKFKKSKGNIIKFLILIIGIFLFYKLFSYLLANINLYPSDSSYVRYLLADSNSYISITEEQDDFLDDIFDMFYSFNLNEPVSLLQETCFYMEEPKDTVLVYNDNYEENIQTVIKEQTEPLVYIFNTHPTEGFNDDELNVHNITPTIRSMSDVLKERLEELGVSTYVEQGDVAKYLKDNNLHYKYSYDGSKLYLQQFLKENDSVKLFIDLHRDGVAYKNSTATIDDKKYAKVMFVIGGASDNYESTLNASKKLNNYFKNNYSELTRGIFERKSSIYNQDNADNMVLIELGGHENNVSEVLNTIDILAMAIKEYIYES